MADFAQVLTVLAPAKVNLILQVLAKRSDGYHELDGIMQKLDLFDTLHIKKLRQPGISLCCLDSVLPEDETNLVYKAAVVFLREAGLESKYGVSLELEKRIPVAAGLGGGSSDAGATLSALNDLFELPLSDKKLLNLAKELGADVPFFVIPKAAVRARGIGEKMTPVASLSHCSVLLVNPGFSVSTAWAFENFRLTRADKVSNLFDSRKNGVLNGFSLELFNDLESVTIDRYPDIESIKECMLENGATNALMSGSGPTVFGVFPDDDNGSVRECAKSLRVSYGDGVFVTRPL
jgi:4-diphosphocytidyl-2-C-methyl-D-erythritol kinase